MLTKPVLLRNIPYWVFLSFKHSLHQKSLHTLVCIGACGCLFCSHGPCLLYRSPVPSSVGHTSNNPHVSCCKRGMSVRCGSSQGNNALSKEWGLRMADAEMEAEAKSPLYFVVVRKQLVRFETAVSGKWVWPNQVLRPNCWAPSAEL